jgi:hypothetical protein
VFYYEAACGGTGVAAGAGFTGCYEADEQARWQSNMVASFQCKVCGIFLSFGGVFGGPVALGWVSLFERPGADILQW